MQKSEIIRIIKLTVLVLLLENILKPKVTSNLIVVDTTKDQENEETN